MARADLIINLVKAGIRSDQAQFQKTVEALAADERAKNYGIKDSPWHTLRTLFEVDR